MVRVSEFDREQAENPNALNRLLVIFIHLYSRSFRRQQTASAASPKTEQDFDGSDASYHGDGRHRRRH